MSCPKCSAKVGIRSVTSANTDFGGFHNGYQCIMCGYYVDDIPRPMLLTLKEFKRSSPSAISVAAQTFAIDHFDELAAMSKKMGWEKVTEVMKEKYGVPLYYQTLRKWHTWESLRRKMPVASGRTARVR